MGIFTARTLFNREIRTIFKFQVDASLYSFSSSQIKVTEIIIGTRSIGLLCAENVIDTFSWKVNVFTIDFSPR